MLLAINVVQQFNKLYQNFGPSEQCFNFFWLSKKAMNIVYSFRRGIIMS
jgi:hypothetical protein